MPMRITGGEARGRLLASLKGLRIRPTADKVREAIFDLIGQEFEGVRVLDLFSGTGILGIEALSRGASMAVFVDRSEQALRITRKNLAACGYESKCILVRRDLRKGLPLGDALAGGRADLVFLDPPYDMGLIPSLLEQLLDRRMIGSPGIVVAETSGKEALPDAVGRLNAVSTKLYGQTKITIYRYEEDQ
jgi:16S rRNA (guanine966-N2)-methyltransferase